MLYRLWGRGFDRSGKTIAEIEMREQEVVKDIFAHALTVAPHASLRETHGATVVVDVPDDEVSNLVRAGLLEATRKRRTKQ